MADTEEYEVEGIGTVMLNEADAKRYGKRAKAVKPAEKARTQPTNKAAKAPANKSA